MHNQETVAAQGISGTRYPFSVYRWGRAFGPAPAVYMVLRKDGANYTPLYIGQTDNLAERFQNHHKQYCFDTHRKTHIAVHPEPRESARFAIETDLVRAYSPTCNG